MDTLLSEHARLEGKGNLEKSIDEVQKLIDLLESAKENIGENPASASMALVQLQNPVKKSFDKLDSNMKEIHSSLGKYSKALDKKFKDKQFPTGETDALASHPSLINRAIAMHLLREGQFGVASTFIEEANARPPPAVPTAGTPNPNITQAWEKDFAAGTYKSEKLQQQFHEMYHILHELRQDRNLAPAIKWARENSAILESRGSNLEFELCRLQFVCLFMQDDEADSSYPVATGPLRAWAYARSEFGDFQHRYAREIQQLLGAMAFWQNVPESPYRRIFSNDSAWEDVAHSFTKEFCSLLGLSADSPLYIAATAGAIALPTLLKMQSAMRQTRTEWTTQNELPVEIPLPPAYHFHSIFVCPVSKEQGTDENPPMMMSCGHVIAKESLIRISKNGSSRIKCPYCPSESHPKDARQVYL